MKALGIIIIIAGIFMFIFPEITLTKKEKVVDPGTVEINKNEDRALGWPSYAGGIAAVSGIIVLAASKKKA